MAEVNGVASQKRKAAEVEEDSDEDSEEGEFLIHFMHCIDIFSLLLKTMYNIIRI